MVSDERRAVVRALAREGRKIRGRWTASCMYSSFHADCILSDVISDGKEANQWWRSCIQWNIWC